MNKTGKVFTGLMVAGILTAGCSSDSKRSPADSAKFPVEAAPLGRANAQVAGIAGSLVLRRSPHGDFETGNTLTFTAEATLAAPTDSTACVVLHIAGVDTASADDTTLELSDIKGDGGPYCGNQINGEHSMYVSGKAKTEMDGHLILEPIHFLAQICIVEPNLQTGAQAKGDCGPTAYFS